MNARCLWILWCAVALSACAASPERQHAELVQLARDADQSYQAGRFDRARDQYEKVVAANPQFVPGHLRLGAIAYREGDMQGARARFERVQQLDPKNAQAKYNLAMLHLNEVTILLDDFVTVSPQAANRGQVLILLGQLREFGGKGSGARD